MLFFILIFFISSPAVRIQMISADIVEKGVHYTHYCCTIPHALWTRGLHYILSGVDFSLSRKKYKKKSRSRALGIKLYTIPLDFKFQSSFSSSSFQKIGPSYCIIEFDWLTEYMRNTSGAQCCVVWMTENSNRKKEEGKQKNMKRRPRRVTSRRGSHCATSQSNLSALYNIYNTINCCWPKTTDNDFTRQMRTRGRDSLNIEEEEKEIHVTCFLLFYLIFFASIVFGNQ